VPDLNWTQFAAALSVFAALAAVAVWIARGALRPYFASAGAHRALEQRVMEVEEMVRASATKRDLQRVDERVAAVERSSISNGEALVGVQDGVKRVEHRLDLIYDFLLTERKK
jgi:hypothetical protein